MGSRYLLSGFQLSMIKSILTGHHLEEAKEIIHDILETQYIGISTNPITDDVIKLKNVSLIKLKRKR